MMKKMSENRGCVLIINQTENRGNTHTDVTNLKDTFEIMGADISVKDDPNLNGVKLIMNEFKKNDFSRYLYVAVVFLAHGGEDGIVKLSEKDIMKVQKTILVPLIKMRALDNKLKLLIMQTCKGDYDFISQTTEGEEKEDNFPKYCAKFFATTEGTKAYRQVDGESLFISALCQRLRQEYNSNDILSIMGNVSQDVTARHISLQKSMQKSLPGPIKEQKPCTEDNFGTKRFFITDGFRDN